VSPLEKTAELYRSFERSLHPPWRKRIFTAKHLAMGYLPFVIRTSIKFYNFTDCIEMIYREYEGSDKFLPARGGVVFDIGAQYGDYSIICSVVYGAEVYSFEPLPENVEILRKNIMRNRARNIHYFQLAVSDTSGTLHGNIRGRMLRNETGNNCVELNSISLDDFCSCLNRMDILKIDVEGFEGRVITGALRTIRRLKPRIILETHSNALKAECDRLLRKEGYELADEGRKRALNTWMNEIQNRFYTPANQ